MNARSPTDYYMPPPPPGVSGQWQVAGGPAGPAAGGFFTPAQPASDRGTGGGFFSSPPNTGPWSQTQMDFVSFIHSKIIA